MRDENPQTREQLAASFFAAHERLRERMREALSAAQLSGYRGCVDVGYFYPGALALGADVRMTIFPVDDRSAPLPHGWVRYEIGDAKEIKIAPRTD